PQPPPPPPLRPEVEPELLGQARVPPRDPPQGEHLRLDGGKRKLHAPPLYREYNTAVLYRDDFEAARARAEALERAVARSLSRLTTVDGAMATLERRLSRALAVGNLLVLGAGVAALLARAGGALPPGRGEREDGRRHP